MNDTANGKNGANPWIRIYPWMIGLLTPPFLGVVIGWVTSNNAHIVNHAERLGVIESQLKDTRDELHHINQKLDKLLEQQRRL
jgi:hypothetical protein